MSIEKRADAWYYKNTERETTKHKTQTQTKEDKRNDGFQALPGRQIFREAEKPSEKRLTKEKSNGYNILSDNADEFPVRNIHP